MKIAFATTDGTHVDEHFGRAGMFAVYDLTTEGSRLVEMRKFSEGQDTTVTSTKNQGQAHDDAVQSKVDRLADCRIVCLTEIGGPSAARLVKKGIMPLKVKETVLIAEELAKLQETVKHNPPPWLRKALKKDSDE
ncbi:MAG: nitrogen fixation protein NifX [Nitrospiraceae bacterium]|nr:nitrogen fixation protein NifX [Nitrospiraceae bacterium]